ncbi:MAG: hypothetical protein C0P72_004345 [Clostridia bacterium]
MLDKGCEKGKVIYPEEFNSNYIFTYFSFNEELKELLEESGQKEGFARKYRRQLIILERLKKQCVQHKPFERLKDNGEIYSMRFVGRLNLRVLFSFFLGWAERDRNLVELFPGKRKQKEK